MTAHFSLKVADEHGNKTDFFLRGCGKALKVTIEKASPEEDWGSINIWSCNRWVCFHKTEKPANEKNTKEFMEFLIQIYGLSLGYSRVSVSA